MGSKYTSQTVTGYNSSPPADDGSAVGSNQVKWSTVKTKVGDPLNNFASAINTALTTAFDLSMTTTAVTYTTTAADHLKPVRVTAAASVHLGDAATMAVGYQTAVVNAYSAAITVDLATAGNKLNTVVGGSISLQPGNAVIVAINQAGDGYDILGVSLYDNIGPGISKLLMSLTDAGATSGPTLTLDRNSASPAASDVMGVIPFTGRNSAAATKTYAQIQAEINDATSTSEDGQLTLWTIIAGTLTKVGILSQGLQLGAPTGGDKGTGTINAASGVYDGGTRILPGWQWISTTDGASASTVNLTSLGTYDVYKIIFEDVVPNGTASLILRVSTDGSTYYSGATDYVYTVQGLSNAGTDDSGNSTGNTYISLCGTTGILSTTSLGGMSGEATLFHLNKTSVRKQVMFNSCNSNNGAILHGFGQAVNATAVSSAVVAVQFLLTASATFTSGKFYLYGLRLV